MDNFEKNNEILENVLEENQVSDAKNKESNTNENEFNSFNVTEEDKNPVINEEFPLDEDFVENSFEKNTVNHSASTWDAVNYTPINPYEDKKPMSKGLKVFSLIMAAVILVSTACIGGYFLGKNKGVNFSQSKVEVDLDAKPTDTDEYTAAQVYEMLNKSIVGIRVYNKNGEASDASGVIYSKDGYVVTNDHIYSEIGAPKFKIYTYDGKEYNAEYVAGDSISDLAVLKINGGEFSPATFGDSSQIVCGEKVTAIGRPSDATAASSISQGIISAVSRRMTTTSNYSARLIQTDSAINPGSSGGALVNMYGQVIGITASKLAGVEYDAIGFAIPTVTMKRVVEQLISNGSVTDRAKLGITYTEINSVSAELGKYKSTGLYIVSATEDSDLYGKVKEGDMITHINGTEITTDEIVLDIIENSKAGDSLTLTVRFTNGTSKDFKVKLKANVGQSSYTESLGSSEDSGQNSDGTFDFPFGE